MFIIMLHIITRRLRIIMIMLMLSPQVILKDSVGITSFGTVSRISRQCLCPCNAPPQQYDIIIRNVSAAGAVVYNGSAAGNNMIGLKLQFA